MPFNEGVAAFSKSGKYGVINIAGKEVVTPKYDYINGFYEGLAAVQKDSKYGFINKEGKEVVTPQYSTIGQFSDMDLDMCNWVTKKYC